MHPFSLNNDEIELVSGGRDVYTTLALGEEGGLPPPADVRVEPLPTTLALGEEGGFPPAD
jgi:hypothetical protein